LILSVSGTSTTSVHNNLGVVPESYSVLKYLVVVEGERERERVHWQQGIPEEKRGFHV
jgi:hypothetical protein